MNGRSLRYPLLRVSSRPQETIVSVIFPENCGEAFVFILWVPRFSKKYEQVLGILFIIHVINIIFYLTTSKFDL